jgi:nucleoside-diphosphate-sugar epimerase
VGQRLVARLAGGMPVRVLSSCAAPTPLKNVEYFVGDVRSVEIADRFARGCNTIVHLAGIAHTSLSTRAERGRSDSVNVEGTQTMLKAALRNGVDRFIFVSTAHVYAAQTGLNLEESSPVRVTGAYAETKIKAEECVRNAGERGLKVVIARPCLIYGPGARFNLERMMRAIDAGYYFHIAGANPLRSVLSIENAARGLQHLAEISTPTGTCNLADELPIHLVDFVNDLADRMGRRRPRTISPTAIGYASAIGTALQSVGFHFSLSREAIAKLTSDFSLSTKRLAATGFTWGRNDGEVRQQMVDHYLQAKRR